MESWLGPHLGCQMSDRQRTVREAAICTYTVSEEDLVNVKDTIHALFVLYSGMQGHRSSVFGLCDPDDGGVYILLFIDKLRMDDAAFTVVLDVAVLPLSNELMPRIHPGLCALSAIDKGLIRVVARGSEIAAWKRLLPAFVERCRTWSHRSSCEYVAHGKVPLSVVMDEMPICSCGRGVNLPPSLKDIPGCKLFLPFATRAAISPLFAVSYVERVAGAAKDIMRPFQDLANEQPSSGKPGCFACQGSGNPKLLVCSKCKFGKYCSAACQREDWKKHKAVCIALARAK